MQPTGPTGHPTSHPSRHRGELVSSGEVNHSGIGGLIVATLVVVIIILSVGYWYLSPEKRTCLGRERRDGAASQQKSGAVNTRATPQEDAPVVRGRAEPTNPAISLSTREPDHLRSGSLDFAVNERTVEQLHHHHDHTHSARLDASKRTSSSMDIELNVQTSMRRPVN